MSKPAKIADMSAFPVRVLPDRSKRTEQNRQSKKASRARAKAKGLVKFEIQLSADKAQLVNWLREAQSGNPETFFADAFVVGAKFRYNAGNVRGGKKRIKGASE